MQVQEKIIPPSTADVIFPPNKDHEYFQQWQEYPFRPLATSLNLSMPGGDTRSVQEHGRTCGS